MKVQKIPVPNSWKKGSPAKPCIKKTSAGGYQPDGIWQVMMLSGL